MKIAFLFPGQGAQYPGMGKDFLTYAPARLIFEEADDLLNRKLSKIIFEGPDNLLTETINSQLGIFVTSIAILKTLQHLYPDLQPTVSAGLSLGEYTAITAAGYLPFQDCLKIVAKRAEFMQKACKARPGSMAVILGLNAEEVELLVKELKMPNDLWAANFNCPGQVVISGTPKGIEAGSVAAYAKGAKRVLPLQVSGAFHSGLMQSAETELAEHILEAPFVKSEIPIAMNVTGKITTDFSEIRANLIRQVTHPVYWEHGIRSMMETDINLFLEIGCGKTLAGFNKRIGVNAQTISIEKIEEIKTLESLLTTWNS